MSNTAMLAVAALSLGLRLAAAFMYRPATGLTWDPSCMRWRNTTYCYFMYACGTGTPGCATNETHYGHGLVATSTDGVHFETHSAFNAEFGEVGWFKCMIHKLKDQPDGSPLFVMDHGTSGPVTGPDDPTKPLPANRGCPAGTSQCLRFLKSHDGLSWEYMYTLHPDPRYYASHGNVSSGRWDHAYIQEDSVRGGYIAFPVATPIGPPGPGQLRSRDGLEWSVEAPTEVKFGQVKPTGFEIGGVERMPNGRYYMIGGAGSYSMSYSMYTMVSTGTDVAGPYQVDAEAYRLSGQDRGAAPSFGQALAAWSRDYDAYPDGGLISQYMVMPYTPDCGKQRSLSKDGHVWLLPFRAPVLEAGHLRLSHWSGNQALKGAPLPVQASLSPAEPVGGLSDTALGWFNNSESWDHTTGA